MENLRDKLRKLQIDFDVTQTVECSENEKKQFSEMEQNGDPLPANIVNEEGIYYKCIDSDLSDQELKTLFMYKQSAYLRALRDLCELNLDRQTEYLKYIRNIMVFFVTITVIAIIAYLSLFSRL